jgi:hypothetical protein
MLTKIERETRPGRFKFLLLALLVFSGMNDPNLDDVTQVGSKLLTKYGVEVRYLTAYRQRSAFHIHRKVRYLFLKPFEYA